MDREQVKVIEPKCILKVCVKRIILHGILLSATYTCITAQALLVGIVSMFSKHLLSSSVSLEMLGKLLLKTKIRILDPWVQFTLS